MNIEKTIKHYLDIDNNDYKKQLSYFQDLENENIKIFDFQIIQIKSRELFNKGVKEFYEKNYKKALDLFQDSIKLNPANPLALWNILRLKVILDNDIITISNNIKDFKKYKFDYICSTTRNLKSINNPPYFACLFFHFRLNQDTIFFGGFVIRFFLLWLSSIRSF